MITAEGVRFAYDHTLVLDDVGLEVPTGETVGVIGPNGCGKTTFLRTLYASLQHHAGRVLLDETDITTFGAREIAERLAVVVQEHPTDLPYTVAEMVLLGRAPHQGMFGRPRGHDHRVAAAALRRVGARHLADRVYATLSGGERQRVLIARAIAQEVDHLLLDEPTNHLDIRYQHEVLALVGSLDVTTVVVLHDLNLAARYCDHLVLLDAGRVARAGPVADVLVPEVLEPVYGVHVQRFEHDGHPQLLFSPIAEDAEVGLLPVPDHP
ncbi:ABC transporter ATP-binding protein [Egicoccus sp. AB-alg6-2]|uniref:ABC transporter ATP-binding protein n=1 Tax=Egicoccus sp. AB-alg6-2 TaxID=3242692 RepID=UPI00359D790D